MKTEQQKKNDEKMKEATSCHDAYSEDEIGAIVNEEQQIFTATIHNQALTENLMEAICDIGNLSRAYTKVCANKGSPGIDGMTTQELGKWLSKNLEELRKALLDGSYRPKAVLGIQIPKPGGGIRQLGIPTVIDRLVQQAILQVLEHILDPIFSENSYGFRPRRSAHQALAKASEYVREGRTIVVDLDLEKFFDRVNHDILMARLVRRVKDKKLLRLIRRYLESGMMSNGVILERQEGTPQGGPLSPLLANLLLDDLDKELEKRGHKFCRYADDCNIYVKTEVAGNRIMQSITGFLEKKLKLKVNREKSAVAEVTTRKFLGYRITNEGKLTIAPKSIEKAKDRIRETTRRKQPMGLEQVIKKLNRFLIGWIGYYQLTEWGSTVKEIEAWIRRKLRCFKLSQMKKPKTIREFLKKQGIDEVTAKNIASSGKGRWRLSRNRPIHQAMSNEWLEKLGLKSIYKRWELLQNLRKTAVYGTVRTVV